MNAWKLWAPLAVVCLAVTVGRGDEKDYPKLIVGKREVTKADEQTARTGAVIEFTKDGKVMATIKKDDKDATLEGTYKVEGDSFTVTMKVGDDDRKQKITILKLTDGELHIKNEMGKMSELTKKK